jgi:hypothetical protein
MNLKRISFAEQCGQNTPHRQAEVQKVLSLAQASGLEWIRLVWCDVHGSLRGKTWVTSELAAAFAEGMGMVSTLMLKDTSDRTVYKVFEMSKLSCLDLKAPAMSCCCPIPALSKYCHGPEKPDGCCANRGFPTVKSCPMTHAASCKARLKKWPPKAGA